MVKRDGAEVRKERIQKIGRYVNALIQKHGRLPLGKTVSVLAYEYGLTKEKIIEYLRILEDLGRFVIDAERDEIRGVASEETSNE